MSSRKIPSSLLLSTALALALTPVAIGQDQSAESETSAPEDDSRTLQTVVVRGEFIPEPQRQTSQVASFLTNEDLVRQGDSNAALALTRVSGLSVVGEKFAYVRGLGDRYSAALLNGSPLPSPEPLRRTVPLDLFPSNILDGAAVQKTYSANYPGEFGGGLIDLRTLRLPRETYFKVGVGVGANTETTGKTGIYVRGSDMDWTGYDDGLRDIPGPIQAALSSGQSINSYSSTEIEAMGESLVNSPLSVIQSSSLGPNYNADVEGGMLISKGEYDIGLIGVAGYDQSWSTRNAVRQKVQGNQLGIDLEATYTALDIVANALGSAALSWGENEVQATVFYVHSTTKNAETSEGADFNAPQTGNVYDESSGWYERELMFGQLRGEHNVAGIDLEWRGSIARSTRDAPYERDLRRIVGTDGVPRFSVANNYSVNFSDLTDDIVSFGADAAYTFDLSGGREAELSGGIDYASTDRDYNYLSLRFAGGNTLPDDTQAARPDYLFSPDNIDPARFVLQEIATTDDSYSASLDVNAAYLQLDADVMPFVKATLGVRYEDAEQRVQTFDRFGNLGAGGVLLANEYFLPSATLTWNFAEDLQLRVGYSKTIARPQFRELALSRFFDPDTDRVYRGNSGLVDSELSNYDARLEYYMGRNQFITLAAFYKDIERPIEEVQFSTSTFVFETTFINTPKAELFGGEFEYRTRFKMPVSDPWFDAREWIFSANYTYTASEVQAGAGETVFDPISRTNIDASLYGIDGSDLQGTPENILNMQFGWESDADQMTLLLNWVDTRILQRGLDLSGAVLPDVIEDPGVQLDLVYRRDFDLGGRVVTLGLSGRNLLNQKHEEYQVSEGSLGRTEFNTYERGQTFSVSLTTDF